MLRKLQYAISFLLIVFVAPLAWSTPFNFQGYYTLTEKIGVFSSGKKVPATSWLNIIKTEGGDYRVTGKLYGPNLHECNISNSDSEEAFLSMDLVKDRLVFSRQVLLDDINVDCEFTIAKSGNFIVLSDPHFNTSKYIFESGGRIDADGWAFPVSKRKPPKTREIQTHLLR